MQDSLALLSTIHHSVFLSLRFSGTWNRVLLKEIVKLLKHLAPWVSSRVVSLLNSITCKTARQSADFQCQAIQNRTN